MTWSITFARQKHKSKGDVLRLLLAGLLFFTMSTVAQEYEVRSEFTYCTLNEGKTLQDVIAQSERYGEFSKEASLENSP